MNDSLAEEGSEGVAETATHEAVDTEVDGIGGHYTRIADKEEGGGEISLQ